MKPLKLIATVLVLLPLSQAAHSATITNGDFSAGLTGWSAQGNVNTSAGYAVLTSAGSGTSTGSFGGTNGSILSQAINAFAGDTISFSYNFWPEIISLTMISLLSLVTAIICYRT